MKCPHCDHEKFDNRWNRDKHVERCYNERQEEKKRKAEAAKEAVKQPKIGSFFSWVQAPAQAPTAAPTAAAASASASASVMFCIFIITFII